MRGTGEITLCAALLAGIVVLSLAGFGLPHRAVAAPRAQPLARAAGPDSADALPADLDALPPTAAGSRPLTGAFARQYIQLAGTGQPADAYVVYRLLSTCATLREREREAAGGDGFQGGSAVPPPDDCAGLDAGQIARRVAWLRAAADARVPGAVADLLAQGPDGQALPVVWNDPRYADWKRATLEEVARAADAGDAPALAALARLYGRGALADDNGAAAVKYVVAWEDAASEVPPAEREALAAAAVERYGRFLSPERLAEAVAAGHRLGAHPS